MRADKVFFFFCPRRESQDCRQVCVKNRMDHFT